MRALSLQDSVVTFRESVQEPHRCEGDVLVDVILAGICETDLQLCKGYMGFSGTLGHEFVGVAREGRYAGQRVVGEINCVCERCEWCVNGLGNHCPFRTVLGILNRDGAFADTLLIPERNLHRVPDSVSNERAVFTEPLAAAIQISKQIDLVGKRVAILGDGRLGILCAQAIRLSTHAIVVVGKHPEKLARFQGLGFECCELSQLDYRTSFDVVIDSTGSPTGLEVACGLVKPRGVVVLKTTVAGEHQLSLASLVINEVTVVGSRCGPFDEALLVLEADAIDLTGMVSHRFPLEQGVEAMRVAALPGSFKVLLDPQR